MLVHVLDISGSEDRNPVEDYYRINDELKRYSERLYELPQIVAANKMDITGADVYLELLREELEDRDVEVFPVSAATGQGFEPLLDEIVKTLDKLPKTYEFEEEEIAVADRYEKGFKISRDGDVYVVEGGTVEYILDTTNADDEESMRRFQQYLIREGIINALREAGAGEDSTVRMGEWEFDFVE